jgi:hypothetical protein
MSGCGQQQAHYACVLNATHVMCKTCASSSDGCADLRVLKYCFGFLRTSFEGQHVCVLLPKTYACIRAEVAVIQPGGAAWCGRAAWAPVCYDYRLLPHALELTGAAIRNKATASYTVIILIRYVPQSDGMGIALNTPLPRMNPSTQRAKPRCC